MATIEMFFQFGPFELLVIAAIIAAPFVVAGVLIWIVRSRPPRGPKD